MLQSKWILKIVFAIFIILFVILKSSLGVPVDNATENNIVAQNVTIDENDFTTEFAKKIIRLSKAADIKSIMNAKADPCDNFYQYACGNWHRANPAQLLGNIMTDKFQILAQAFDRRLDKLLTKPANGSNPMEVNVHDLYNACKDMTKDPFLIKLALKKIYNEYGEFPAIAGDDWDATKFVWWELIAKIHNKYGRQIILAVDIMSDIKNNSENKIYLGSPEFATMMKSKVLDALQEASTASSMEKYLGLSSKVAKSVAKDIIAFEHALMKGGTDVRAGVKTEDLIVPKDVSNLTEEYSEYLSIHEYLQLVLGTTPPDSIYVYDEQYLKHVIDVIETYPPETVANYILWELLHDYSVNEREKNMDKFCLEKTKKFYGKYIDHIVYKDYRSEKTEKEVHAVWTEIQDTFREELKGDKLDWISNATRESAIEKLNEMKLDINSYDDENFTAIYGSLNFFRNNYFEIIQKLLQHESKRNLARLNETGSSLDSTEVLSFTPAYNLLENNIKIPVALLQPHYFWDDDYPQAIKYSTLGYLIAHEIIHGFDDDGRSYDKLGNQREWWDERSTYEFEERRKCFQAQYHNYQYDGVQLQESISQSENIADNAGIKLAYKTYMRWLQNHRADDPQIEKKETLPNLDYDNRQLFFLSFAQVWCDDVQSFFKSTVASADTHAPGMYRVIGSLSNFQEFSWVFHCKQNANMDPEFKCAIY